MNIIYLLLAQLTTGINLTGSKYLIQNKLSILFLMEMRFIFGALTLLILLMIQHKQFSLIKIFKSFHAASCKDWIYLCAQGLCAGLLFNIMMLLGIHYTTASMAGLITSTLPAIVILMSSWALREKLTRQKILCVIFATIGLIIINANSFIGSGIAIGSLLGVIIMLIAMVPESLYYILTKLHPTKLSAMQVAFILNFINAIISLPILLFSHIHIGASLAQLSVTEDIVLVLVSLGSALFYLCWSLGVHQTSATTSGLMTAFMPISTLIIAYLFLNEKITTLELIGMGFILFSIIISAVRKPSLQKKPRMKKGCINFKK